MRNFTCVILGLLFFLLLNSCRSQTDPPPEYEVDAETTRYEGGMSKEQSPPPQKKDETDQPESKREGIELTEGTESLEDDHLEETSDEDCFQESSSIKGV